MIKRTQKEQKQNNNLNKFLSIGEKTQPKKTTNTAHKSEGKKKIPIPPQENKEKPSNLQSTPAKIQLQLCLKEVSIETIIQKCPKIHYLLGWIESKSSLSSQIVKSLMRKCLKSKHNCLWGKRYAPDSIFELFDVSSGQKIQEWIDAFFDYKNKIVEEDSFLNDFSDEKSCKVYQNIRANNWQLQALIVRGRPGVGKTSAVRAVAKEMNIDIQQCGNEYNQTKYLKEKNQSTQSQSVKTAYTKKVKIQKNAQMITKYMPPVEKERQKESTKIQFIHNISVIYPENDAPKFYQELSRCVDFSKIPFIMTNSGEKLPRQCEKYDVIEFGSFQNDLIVKVLWAIIHIESLIGLDKLTLIEQDKAIEQIQRQTSSIVFREICSLEKVKDVCQLYNYRLDYIFTFIEHHQAKISFIDTFPLQVTKYKEINQDKFLQEILFIDFEQLHLNSSSPKSQDQNTLETENDKSKNNITLQTYKHYLKLAATEDTLHKLNDNFYNNQSSIDLSDWDERLQNCIDMKVHRGIKQSLVKMINIDITGCQRTRSSMKISQLSYLPMIVKGKRSNRASRGAMDTLKRLYDANELCYLQHFGNFIRND